MEQSLALVSIAMQVLNRFKADVGLSLMQELVFHELVSATLVFLQERQSNIAQQHN